MSLRERFSPTLSPAWQTKFVLHTNDIIVSCLMTISITSYTLVKYSDLVMTACWVMVYNCPSSPSRPPSEILPGSWKWMLLHYRTENCMAICVDFCKNPDKTPCGTISALSCLTTGRAKKICTLRNQKFSVKTYVIKMLSRLHYELLNKLFKQGAN